MNIQKEYLTKTYNYNYIYNVIIKHLIFNKKFNR